MRIDGRRADELRAVHFSPGYQSHAEGSVLAEFGLTRVVCSATVEDRVPSHRAGTNEGWVTGEYAMLPRATQTRSPRPTAGGLPGRSVEISRLIGRSLRAAVDLAALGSRTSILDCDVLEADGGTRTAAVSGAYVALALAVRRLRESRLLRANPLVESIAAVSVGIVDGEPRLDLCYEEDFRAAVDMNVITTGQGRLVDIQATAEGRPFSREQLDELLALAQAGIQEITRIQQEVLSA
jgi:ribonuclease PH